jgi:hypothetical protein
VQGKQVIEAPISISLSFRAGVISKKLLACGRLEIEESLGTLVLHEITL